MTDARDRDERSERVSPDDESDGGDLTSPEPGLADPAAQIAAERGGADHDHRGHDEPPADDERGHEADFAPDGYDDRETDTLPRMPGE
jgi:hypothetical protein